MRAPRIPIVSLLTHATLAALVAGASPLQAQFADVRGEIERLLVEESLPSLAVAVARGGEIVWEEGFGWADRERRIPATEHTMYSLASISKPITATGLMVLVERGSVDLDRPVDHYLGAAKLNGRAFDAREATVRRVAGHSAGLPLHYQFFYEDEAYRRPPMDETIRRYANLVTAPGERYQYSNLGYGILDYVIERASGIGYADFMRQEVFLPLGLTRMSVHIGPGLEAYAATRYAPDGTPIPFYDFDHPGGSAVFASAHDLVRFALFHLKARLPDQRRVLSDASIDEMRRATVETGERSGYGIGWSLAEHPAGLRYVRHTGGMGGVATTLTLVPDAGTAVVVLCNARSRAPHTVAAMILEALFPDRFAVDEPPAGADPGEGDPRPAEGPAFQPMPQVEGLWRGVVDTYDGERSLVLTVADDGAAYVRLSDQPWALVNDASFEDGSLRGFFVGDLGTEDVSRTRSVLRLELKLRGDALNGSLIGMTVPGARVGNALAHWVDLRR